MNNTLFTLFSSQLTVSNYAFADSLNVFLQDTFLIFVLIRCRGMCLPVF